MSHGRRVLAQHLPTKSRRFWHVSQAFAVFLQTIIVCLREAATRDSLAFYRMQMSVSIDRLEKACVTGVSKISWEMGSLLGHSCDLGSVYFVEDICQAIDNQKVREVEEAWSSSEKDKDLDKGWCYSIATGPSRSHFGCVNSVGSLDPKAFAKTSLSYDRFLKAGDLYQGANLPLLLSSDYLISCAVTTLAIASWLFHVRIWSGDFYNGLLQKHQWWPTPIYSSCPTAATDSGWGIAWGCECSENGPFCTRIELTRCWFCRGLTRARWVWWGLQRTTADCLQNASGWSHHLAWTWEWWWPGQQGFETSRFEDVNQSSKSACS